MQYSVIFSKHLSPKRQNKWPLVLAANTSPSQAGPISPFSDPTSIPLRFSRPGRTHRHPLILGSRGAGKRRAATAKPRRAAAGRRRLGEVTLHARAARGQGATRGCELRAQLHRAGASGGARIQNLGIPIDN